MLKADDPGSARFTPDEVAHKLDLLIKLAEDTKSTLAISTSVGVIY